MRNAAAEISRLLFNLNGLSPTQRHLSQAFHVDATSWAICIACRDPYTLNLIAEFRQGKSKASIRVRKILLGKQVVSVNNFKFHFYLPFVALEAVPWY